MAVGADLMEKVNSLAEDGEGEARPLAGKTESVRGRTDARAVDWRLPQAAEPAGIPPRHALHGDPLS